MVCSRPVNASRIPAVLPIAETLLAYLREHPEELLRVLRNALALRFGVIGAIGGLGGALVALALPASALRIVFAAFLALVGVRLVRDGVRT